MTDPINSILPQAPASGAEAVAPGTAAASSGSSLNADAFLKLLVAQLEYQDPSNPADPTQFLAETAQFTQVQSLNTLTAQSKSSLIATQDTTAAATIGRWVDATGTKGNDITGIVTGIRITSDGPVLQIGTQETPLTAVKEVRAQAPASPASP